MVCFFFKMFPRCFRKGKYIESWIFTKFPWFAILKNHPMLPNKGFLSNLPILLSVCPGARDAWQDQTASHHNQSFEGPLLRKDHKSQMFLLRAVGCLNKWNPKQNGHQDFQVPKMEESWTFPVIAWGLHFYQMDLRWFAALAMTHDN